MKRPLLSVAILFMAGIVAADLLPLPPVPLLISAALLAAVCFCSARASSFLLVPMVILLGGALHSAQTTPASGCDVRLLASEKPEFVTVRGMLMGTPDRRPGNDDGTQPPRTLARVSVTEFWNDEQRVERVSGTIVTTTL